nr:hypothetical protein [uncultured Dyadobacter sp.]
MRSFYASVIFLLFPFLLPAQIEKGKNMYSGNFDLDYWNFSQEGVKTSTWRPGLALEAHRFVKPGLTLGSELDGSVFLQNIKFSANGGSKPARGYSVSVTPQIRKFWKVSPFFLYAGAGVNVAATWSRSYLSYENQKLHESRLTTFNLMPQARLGLIYPLTKRLSLEAAGISNLYPISFNSLKIGLVALTGEGQAFVSEAVGSGSALAPGRWVLSGTFSSSNTKSSGVEGDSSWSYRTPASLIHVGTGVFLTNRLLIGAEIVFGFRESALNDPGAAGFMSVGNSKPWSIGIRPYVRKYMTAMRLTPFWEVGANYSRIMAGAGPTNTYSANGSVGLAYVFGKHWILQTKLAGLTVGYSKLPDNKSEVATLLGGEKISAVIDGGLKPTFTLAYSFK